MDSACWLSRCLSPIFARLFHFFAAMALPGPKIKALWNLRGFLLLSAE